MVNKKTAKGKTTSAVKPQPRTTRSTKVSTSTTTTKASNKLGSKRKECPELEVDSEHENSDEEEENDDDNELAPPLQKKQKTVAAGDEDTVEFEHGTENVRYKLLHCLDAHITLGSLCKTYNRCTRYCKHQERGCRYPPSVL